MVLKPDDQLEAAARRGHCPALARSGAMPIQQGGVRGLRDLCEQQHA